MDTALASERAHSTGVRASPGRDGVARPRKRQRGPRRSKTRVAEPKAFSALTWQERLALEDGERARGAGAPGATPRLTTEEVIAAHDADRHMSSDESSFESDAEGVGEFLERLHGGGGGEGGAGAGAGAAATADGGGAGASAALPDADTMHSLLMGSGGGGVHHAPRRRLRGTSGEWGSEHPLFAVVGHSLDESLLLTRPAEELVSIIRKLKEVVMQERNLRHAAETEVSALRQGVAGAAVPGGAGAGLRSASGVTV